MRRPASALRAVLLCTALVAGPACSDDDGGSSGTTEPTSDRQPTTTIPSDPALEALLVQPSDLPAGFAPVAAEVDTVTTFCAGEDATAGLRASGRAVASYARTPPGASVVHLVFRFEGDGAATFVRQASEILGRCHEVPDLTGLAYSYSPAPAALEAVLEPTDAHVVRHGANVGSGSLQEEVAVFHRGDVGHLVAVLTNDQPRQDLEALALAALTAAVEPAPAG